MSPYGAFRGLVIEATPPTLMVSALTPGWSTRVRVRVGSRRAAVAPPPDFDPDDSLPQAVGHERQRTDGDEQSTRSPNSHAHTPRWPGRRRLADSNVRFRDAARHATATLARRAQPRHSHAWPTAVFFHAHPDDEAIATGGTMARVAAEGHRVVLVCATKGELGEVADGFLDPASRSTDRRVAEVHAAADLLGARRVAFLGYRDSGMDGEPTTEGPEVLRDGRPRRGRRPPRDDPARGGRRGPHRLRRARQLRPSRPHPGAPRRDPRRGARGNRRGLRVDHEPRLHHRPDAVARRGDGRHRRRARSRRDGPRRAGRRGSPRPSTSATTSSRSAPRWWRTRARSRRSRSSSSCRPDAFRAAFGQEWFIRRGPDRAAVEDTLFPRD